MAVGEHVAHAKIQLPSVSKANVKKNATLTAPIRNVAMMAVVAPAENVSSQAPTVTRTTENVPAWGAQAALAIAAEITPTGPAPVTHFVRQKGIVARMFVTPARTRISSSATDSSELPLRRITHSWTDATTSA